MAVTLRDILRGVATGVGSYADYKLRDQEMKRRERMDQDAEVARHQNNLEYLEKKFGLDEQAAHNDLMREYPTGLRAHVSIPGIGGFKTPEIPMNRGDLSYLLRKKAEMAMQPPEQPWSPDTDPVIQREIWGRNNPAPDAPVAAPQPMYFGADGQMYYTAPAADKTRRSTLPEALSPLNNNRISGMLFAELGKDGFAELQESGVYGDVSARYYELIRAGVPSPAAMEQVRDELGYHQQIKRRGIAGIDWLMKDLPAGWGGAASGAGRVDTLSDQY